MKRKPTSSPRALARYLALEGHGPRASHVLAARVLRESGSLDRLRALSDRALADMLGLGAEAAERLRAAMDLASPSSRRRPPMEIACPDDVFRWANARLLGLPHEELWVLALDARSRLRAARCVARGGINTVSVAVRDVLRAVLAEGASAFVLVHNHPSGDPTPSREDERVTRDVHLGSLVIGVPLVDHVVVGTEGYRAVRSCDPCELPVDAWGSVDAADSVTS